MIFKAVLLFSLSLFTFGFAPVTQDPAKLPGFGKPELVSKSATGWAKVKFADIGFTIDLPNWPTPAEMEWDAEDGKTTKAWAGYDFSSRKLTGDIYTYEAVDDEGFQAEDSREQELESYDDTQRYASVKAAKSETVIDGKKVILLDVS